MDEQFEKLDPDACSKTLQMIRGVRDVGISCMWTLAGLGETGELFVNTEKVLQNNYLFENGTYFLNSLPGCIAKINECLA